MPLIGCHRCHENVVSFIKRIKNDEILRFYFEKEKGKKERERNGNNMRGVEPIEY